VNLFIDTNIFLGFYHLSSEDLEELRKLSVLMRQGKITLYLPKQVVDEFSRNRDSKIADALKRFRDDKLNDQFPQMSKEYDEYKTMREGIGQYAKAKSALLDKLTIDIEGHNLKADAIIKQLFDTARIIDVSPDILERARTRCEMANPPGKAKSCGDAINWESLLEACPHSEDLHFITDDADYFSELRDDRFSSFLLDEWHERKTSEILFLKRLSSFFKDNFPDIKLASELEKQLLITDLTQSPTFASTKHTLKKLSKFTDFTDDELNEIVLAAISNNQIYWIMGDSIVTNTLTNIVDRNEDRIDATNLAELHRLMGRAGGPDGAGA